MNEDPQFPQYQPPQGIPLDTTGQHRPLMKMVKSLMKPMRSRDPFHARRPGRKGVKNQVRFY